MDWGSELSWLGQNGAGAAAGRFIFDGPLSGSGGQDWEALPERRQEGVQNLGQRPTSSGAAVQGVLGPLFNRSPHGSVAQLADPEAPNSIGFAQLGRI